MTSFLLIEFLLLLLPQKAYSEDPYHFFARVGEDIEMGNCYGADYIVAYRLGPQGDQLLGNSSDDFPPIETLPDQQDRVSLTGTQFIFEFQISNLTTTDSGIYRMECWQNKTLTADATERLTVCVDSSQVTLNEEDGVEGTEIFCTNSSAGTSIQWFFETGPYPTLGRPYELIVDNNVSTNILVEKLQGVVKVKDFGASLWVANGTLQRNVGIYCLVQGGTCVTFHNTTPQESIHNIFATQGDKVVLKCPTNSTTKRWQTPQGWINGTTTFGRGKKKQMYTSDGDDSKSYSLIIPAVSVNHEGQYSCYTPTLGVKYQLSVCSKRDPESEAVFEGGEVTLKCNSEQEYENVLWYRRGTSGEDDIIQDSGDKSVAIPEDLRGRVVLSEDGFSLTLSNLTVKDMTVYWCLVLEGTTDDDYDHDYDDISEEEEYEEDDADEYWLSLFKCSFKQETILNMGKRISRSTHATSNATAYGVGIGVAALVLVVGVIAAVTVITRRANVQNRRSGHNENDIKLNVDPGASNRLTSNNEQDAED